MYNYYSTTIRESDMHNKGTTLPSPESKIVEKIFINKLFDVKIDSPTKELIFTQHLKLLIS